MMSSALEVALDIIDKEYHPNSWNIYTFNAGDGENWESDNNPTVNLLSSLKEVKADSRLDSSRITLVGASAGGNLPLIGVLNDDVREEAS